MQVDSQTISTSGIGNGVNELDADFAKASEDMDALTELSIADNSQAIPTKEQGNEVDETDGMLAEASAIADSLTEKDDNGRVTGVRWKKALSLLFVVALLISVSAAVSLIASSTVSLSLPSNGDGTSLDFDSLVQKALELVNASITR
jgi:hypothetical protein